MSTEDEALRDRVRTIITRTKTTQGDLADVIGISPSKLSKSLSGARRFSTYELAAIAQHGGTTVEWLLTGEEEPPLAVAARGVSHASAAWDAAIERTETLSGVDAALSELDVPQLPVLAAPPRPEFSGRAIEDGPLLAEATRTVLADCGLAAGLRNDIAGTIESAFGIHVAAEALGAGFDGLARCRKDFRLILINTQISWSRQRFTIAHELGHHLAGDVHANGGLIADKNVMATGHALAEMRANAFAAALLMPKQQIEESVNACSTLDAACFGEMVGRYLVSADALAWRLKGLRLVDEARRIKLARTSAPQAARDGGWTEEYLDLVQHQGRARLPQLLTHRTIGAFVDGTVSAQLPAKLLKCDPGLLYDALDGVVTGEPASDREPVFVP
jgi:Zn-dependent peptidase ImmA (M78 family)/transcriptional regulator with XRE-family HTH domain